MVLTLCNLLLVISQDGATPLHFAAAKGHDTTAEALVRAGANVHAVDNVRPLSLRERPCAAPQLRMIVRNDIHTLLSLSHAFVFAERFNAPPHSR
jgi:hypothetical protein